MKYLVYPDGKVEESRHHQVNEAHLEASGVKVVEANSVQEAKEKAGAGETLSAHHEVDGEMKDSVQQAADREEAPAQEEEQEAPVSRKSRR